MQNGLEPEFQGTPVASGADSRLRIWYDVTSLLRFMSRHAHPTGIQRVMLNVLAAARASAEGDPETELTLVRYDPVVNSFLEIDFDSFDRFMGTSHTAENLWFSVRIGIRNFLNDNFPGGLGNKLGDLYSALGSFARTCRGKVSVVVNKDQYFPTAPDVYMNLGSFWGDEYNKNVWGFLSGNDDVTVVHMIYDMIPVVHPEMFLPSLRKRFTDQIAPVAGQSDLLLFSSTSAQEDCRAFLERGGHAVPALAKVSFGDARARSDDPSDQGSEILQSLGLDRPYVLMVGTLEIRKNHVLAVKAWKHLLNKYPDTLPLLVFVGQWGWKTEGLREELDRSRNLDGQVRIISGLSDEALDAVYRGALFTLFPSLYEGWGLPVTESHAYGKVCVASNSSSIPEAARGFAVLFENNDENSLIDAVEPLLFDRQRLARLEARIRDEFVPVPWSRTWQDILDAVREVRAPR